MLSKFGRIVMLLAVVLVLLMAAATLTQAAPIDEGQTVYFQGDPLPQEPADPLVTFRDPAVLAGLIMLIFPQLFDLFEQWLIRMGWDGLISGPNRKRLVAWLLAAPLALAVQAFAALAFREPFSLDSVWDLAAATVPFVVASQLSFLAHRATGGLITARDAVA